jgi:hypothetical protein
MVGIIHPCKVYGAMAVARPVLFLSHVMRPLVWFVTGVSNLVLRLFRDRTTFTEARLSPQELEHLVEQATRSGSVDPRTGEIVSRALVRMGYRTVRGSSSAGGREALGEMSALLREGWGAAIIADGPRGPARVSKIGPGLAARASGAPLLMWGVHAKPSITMRNWDQTMIPKPFATITLAYGGPIYVPPGADREECEAIRGRVDQKMAELEATCRSSATS